MLWPVVEWANDYRPAWQRLAVKIVNCYLGYRATPQLSSRDSTVATI